MVIISELTNIYDSVVHVCVTSIVDVKIKNMSKASMSVDVNKNRSFGKRDVGNSRVVPDVRAMMLKKTVWREKYCNLVIVLDVSEGIRTDKFDHI